MRSLADWLLVVGTGLMGGSVAQAARAAGVVQTVYGYDPAQGAQAQSLGLVDHALPSLQALQPSGAGLVVLAAPVTANAQQVGELAKHWERWGRPYLTDLGSTKTALIQALERLRADHGQASGFLSHSLSSHPMAGSEAHGPAAARAELFQGARVLLSAFPETTPACEVLWQNFWQALGGRTHRLALADHDPLLAAISHLPHAAAYALGAQLASSPHAQAAQWLHGGGLRDTTRIAASSPGLWADIFLDNREALTALLKGYQAQLADLAEAVQNQDRPALVRILEQSAGWRHGFEETRPPHKGKA